jgi:rhomboid protease GluP
MYALIYIGLLLEPRLGKLKFTAAYFLTGIAASLCSLWWHDLTVSAGASGAIFGMYGVFLAMLTTNLIEKSARIPMLTSIGIFVLYNLMNGVKQGIDNAAHIGGLLCGLIIGYSFYPSLKKNVAQKLEYTTVVLLAVLVLSFSFIIMKKIPNDIPKYDAKMETFGSNESKALAIYHMPKNTPNDSLLYEIKQHGFYYWNENIKLLHEADKLDIPQILHEKNSKLLIYCDLRIKSYNLIYKMIDENTDAYKDSLTFYNKQIESAINSLKEK